MAAPLLGRDVEILVSCPVESHGYIDLTIHALSRYGVRVEQSMVQDQSGDHLRLMVPGDSSLVSPGCLPVEGDWSNAAFWLAAGAIGTQRVDVIGLDAQSRQADRSIMSALSLLGCRVERQAQVVSAMRDDLRGATIDISGMPDLAAPLAAVACVAAGTTRLTGAARLRLKESDRLESIRAALCGLGGKVGVVDDTMLIEGVERLPGGTVDACRDHRIAMMGTVSAAYASGPSIIRGAECVAKSYPRFFDDFRKLGGIAYEVEA
jgi:3-phosphoshikimate 1-carboxyvinyltransferase